MTRPTALIRRLLILEMLQNGITQQIRSLKQQIAQSDIVIIERQSRTLDVWIRYSYRQREYEALYMRAMLEAEVASNLSTVGEIQ